MIDNDVAWYRELGDAYARIVEQPTHDLAKEMNASEAAKYSGIARSIESRSATSTAENTA